MIPTKGYGLRHLKTGKLMSVSTRSNSGGDCCCETQYMLDDYSDSPWIVDNIVTAAYVRENSTEWYNAGYETPTNDYNAEDLEVVEIELVVKNVEQPKLPTPEEYIERRYNTPGMRSYDPKHAAWTKSKDYYYSIKYCLYDLIDLIDQESKLK